MSRAVRNGASFMVVMAILVGVFVTTPGRALAAGEIRTPQDVMIRAEAAAKILARNLKKGNYSYSIQKMYPRYRTRMARQMGGLEALSKKMASIPDEMRKRGLTMLDVQVDRPTVWHPVHFVMVPGTEGKEVRVPREYLVFVPTRTYYRQILPQEGTRSEARTIEITGYQAAIAHVDKPLEWTFINGSNLTIPELRSLFPSLPKDEQTLGLPKVEVQEVTAPK